MHDATRRDERDATAARPVVSVADAALALGISPGAVRKRIERGQLAGHKVAGQWRVVLDTTDATRRDETDATRQDTTDATGDRPGRSPQFRGDVPAGVDLAPLVELVERQGDEIRRLAEASTAWQFRALQAEEKLKALGAGDTSTITTDNAYREPSGPHEPLGPPAWRARTSRAVDVDAPGSSPSWWRRWLGRR